MNMELNEIEIEIYEDREDEVVYLSSTVNYHNITKDDMLNGDGLRVVLWLAGCTHHCKECQNPITWDPDGGLPFTQWEESEFYEALSKPYIEGATFSGGDPLHPRNRDFVGKMMKNIKEKYSTKTNWLYTGFRLVYEDGWKLSDEWGNTFEYEYLKYIDVLVDGKFECTTRQRDIEGGTYVPWRGSSNQRIIDIQETLKQGKIITRIYDKTGNVRLMEEI